MRLLIFGDSFAAHTVTGTWISTLANLLRRPFTSYGRPGSSLFYTYKQILSADITPKDIVVVVATSNGRLYSGTDIVYGNLSTAVAALNLVEKQQLPVVKAIISYYKYLQNDDFDDYVYSSLIRDIEKILQSQRCQYLFIQSHNNISTDNLLSVPTLNRIISKQNGDLDPGTADEKYKLTNHLTDKNQELLARAAYNHFQGQPIQLTLNDFYKLDGRP